MFRAAVPKNAQIHTVVSRRSACSSAKQAIHFTSPRGVWDPVRLKRSHGGQNRLLRAIRKKDQAAVWHAYNALIEDNKLGSLSAECHTMTLQALRLNKVVAYGPEHVDTVKDRILSVVENMKSLNQSLDVRDYNHLIQFFGSAGDWMSCNTYWEELTAPSSTIQPNTYSFNSYMRAAIQCGMPEKVPVIRGDMLKHNVAPNDFTYHTLIEAYGYLGDLKEVDTVFQRNFCPQPSRPPTPKRFFLQPQPNSTYSYAANAGGLAQFLPRRPPSRTPSVHTFKSLIAAHGRQGNLSGLNHIYQVMIPAAKVKPTLDVYNELMRWFCHHEDVESARKIFVDMETADVKPNVVTFNHMFRLEALKKHRPKMAEMLIDFMKQVHKLQPLQSMYRHLIKIHAKSNRDAEANRLHHEMKSSRVPS